MSEEAAPRIQRIDPAKWHFSQLKIAFAAITNLIRQTAISASKSYRKPSLVRVIVIPDK
jgi:hypothetical protein